MTERQPHVATFNGYVEKWLDNGLTDLKFFVGETSESTMDAFCREANEIEEALLARNFHVHDWESDPDYLDA